MRYIRIGDGSILTEEEVVEKINKHSLFNVTKEDLTRLFSSVDPCKKINNPFEAKSELREKLKKEIGETLNKYHGDGVSEEEIYEILKEKTAFAEFAAFGKW